MFIYNLFEKQQDPANNGSTDLKVVSEAFKMPPESVQDKLHRRHQELRKKRGAPSPAEMAARVKEFDLPDEERYAILKKRYGIEEGEYADDDEYYGQDEQESELYSGCYVRDEQDPSGEIFQMRGDPSERRVQILDRNGSGWNISPDRLTLVHEGDPDIGRYFGGKDIDEGNELNVGVEAYGVLGENNKKWRKTFKSQAAFEKWLDANQDNVEVLGTREVNLNNMFKEDKWFKTQYGWAGGSKPGGGKYKHPDQIKADRAAKKAEKEKQSSDAFGGMFGGGNPADKLSIRKEGVAEAKDPAAKIASLEKKYNDIKDQLGLARERRHMKGQKQQSPAEMKLGEKMSEVYSQLSQMKQGMAEAQHRDPDWYLEPDQPKSARYQPNPDRERGRRQQRDTDYPAEPMARHVPDRKEIAYHKAEKARKAKELAGVMKHMWGKKNMSEGRVDSAASQAIIRRIVNQHHGIISRYGPEAVMSAIDQVADWVGDVEEIGSSDVSAWVQQVIRYVQSGAGEGIQFHGINEQGLAEGATAVTSAGDNAAYANYAGARAKGDLLSKEMTPDTGGKSFVSPLARNITTGLAGSNPEMEERDINEDIERYVEALSRAGYDMNEGKVRLDPKCWKGKKIGSPKTKMKGGVRVNNCVPK